MQSIAASLLIVAAAAERTFTLDHFRQFAASQQAEPEPTFVSMDYIGDVETETTDGHQYTADTTTSIVYEPVTYYRTELHEEEFTYTPEEEPEEEGSTTSTSSESDGLTHHHSQDYSEDSPSESSEEEAPPAEVTGTRTVVKKIPKTFNQGSVVYSVTPVRTTVAPEEEPAKKEKTIVYGEFDPIAETGPWELSGALRRSIERNAQL